MQSPVIQPAQPATRAISCTQERSPADLRPWPTNPRTHSDKQLPTAAPASALHRTRSTDPFRPAVQNRVLTGE